MRVDIEEEEEVEEEEVEEEEVEEDGTKPLGIGTNSRVWGNHK